MRQSASLAPERVVQWNLTANCIEAVNRDEAVAAPLSEYWAVEYHFLGDNFSVRPLPDYLTYTQRSFHERRLFDSVILALHPTRQGANEECEIWQKRRDERPLSPQERLAELQRYVEGLESQI